MSFKSLFADLSIFINDKIIISKLALAIYMNNIFIASKYKKDIYHVKQLFKSSYKIKDLKKTRVILGI